jgi:hypothetical protein
MANLKLDLPALELLQLTAWVGTEDFTVPGTPEDCFFRIPFQPRNRLHTRQKERK